MLRCIIYGSRRGPGEAVPPGGPPFHRVWKIWKSPLSRSPDGKNSSGPVDIRGKTVYASPRIRTKVLVQAHPQTPAPPSRPPPLGRDLASRTVPVQMKRRSKPFGLLRLGGGGWIRTTEANATDLQSAPFGHSGTPPYAVVRSDGAGGRIRTPDLLITNQLLYQLSYTSALTTVQQQAVVYQIKGGLSSHSTKFSPFFFCSAPLGQPAGRTPLAVPPVRRGAIPLGPAGRQPPLSPVPGPAGDTGDKGGGAA